MSAEFNCLQRPIISFFAKKLIPSLINNYTELIAQKPGNDSALVAD